MSGDPLDQILRDALEECHLRQEDRERVVQAIRTGLNGAAMYATHVRTSVVDAMYEGAKELKRAM